MLARQHPPRRGVRIVWHGYEYAALEARVADLEWDLAQSEKDLAATAALLAAAAPPF